MKPTQREFLRDRLAYLVRRFGASEVGRKTGFSDVFIGAVVRGKKKLSPRLAAALVAAYPHSTKPQRSKGEGAPLSSGRGPERHQRDLPRDDQKPSSRP